MPVNRVPGEGEGEDDEDEAPVGDDTTLGDNSTPASPTTPTVPPQPNRIGTVTGRTGACGGNIPSIGLGPPENCLQGK